MAQHGASKAGSNDTVTRRAKNRLKNMRTQEVSLVDQAANLRGFVMTKAACGAPDDETVKADPAAAPPAAKADPDDEEGCIAEGNDPEACAEAAATGEPVENAAKAEGDAPPPEGAMPDEPEGQPPPAIALPAAVKDAVLGGLAQMLDSLTDIAEMVNAATVDDSAPVPPELTQALSDCGSMCQGLLDQASAPAPAEGAAPEGAMAEEKALVGAAAAGVSKAMATALRPGYIAKAGRKMAAARLSMLKQAHDILLGLLKELMDETSSANGGAAPPPPPQRQPPPPPPQAPQQKALANSEPSLDAVSKQLTQLIGLIQAQGKQLQTQGEKIREQGKVVAQFQKSQGTPLAGGVPEGGTTMTPTPPVVWESDLAAAAQSRRAANGAASGAK